MRLRARRKAQRCLSRAWIRVMLRFDCRCRGVANDHDDPRREVPRRPDGRRALQVVGAINAYHARLAQRVGYKAVYLSGGGVAAGSLGLPDLGISNLDDVLTDVRRITDVCDLPLLVDVDTGFGASAFNIARTTKSLVKFGAAAMHIEDQVGAKRCGHRPGKELVSKEEMVDRVKAAVDARTDPAFFIIARTDALAVEGLDAAIERARRASRPAPTASSPRR